jgi:hypothetical protein
MLKGNKLKLQRGAAAKTEDEDRNNDGENRHHAETVRLACENLQCFSSLWILNKDSLGEIRHYHPGAWASKSSDQHLAVHVRRNLAGAEYELLPPATVTTFE